MNRPPMPDDVREQLEGTDVEAYLAGDEPSDEGKSRVRKELARAGPYSSKEEQLQACRERL